ncbi:MAG: amino acid permease [Firmicutes bacterium]|nr:amino acid permease [Bacillota bacterium]
MIRLLKRELGLIDVIMITAGSMIAAGLFVLPGIAFSRAGPAVILSYGLAAMIALPTLLSAAELSTAMPKAGGIYFFVSRGIGYSIGSIAGFSRWFAITLKSSYALLGIGLYSTAFTGFNPKVVAVAACLIFVVINLLGIKIVGFAQLFFTALLLGLIGVFIISSSPSISMDHFVPFFSSGFKPVLATAGFIFISYGGMLVITGLAEEVKRPRRNIPLGMIIGLLVTALIYVAVVVVTVGVSDAEALITTFTPVADVAGITMGHVGLIVASLAAFLAFITTANAGIAAASRYPLAMSRDGLLPYVMGAGLQKGNLPSNSIFCTGLLILLAIVFLPLDTLVEIASSMLLISYILANLAQLVIRKKKEPNYRPTFTAPFYPWLQYISIAGLLVLLIQIGIKPLLFALVISGLAFLVPLVRARYLGDNSIPLPPEPKSSLK